jgi:nitrite reductase/ring-hydroxylating ferredoxin subunit
VPEFTKIGNKADLPGENQAREFTVNGKVICVANVDGKYAAMDNVCLHRGGALGQGVVLDGKVICPWHGWMWDPVTGAAMQNSNVFLSVYKLEIRGEDVWVEM